MTKRIVTLFILSRVLLLCFATAAEKLFPLQTLALAKNFAFGTPYLYWIWANFDGVQYLTIAKFGYAYPNFAFFPLMPLLISLFTKLTSAPFIQSGIILTNTFLILSLFFVYKIARQDYGETIAWRACILLIFFPTAVFYSAIYTDALYLLLSIVSFYMARNSRWFFAGFFGFFAGTARLVGITLFVAEIIEWYIQTKPKHLIPAKREIKKLLVDFFKKRVYFLFLILGGLIAYGFYLKLNFGNFFFFKHQ